MIDAQWESAKPSEAGLTLVLGQLSPPNEYCERIGHFQWPQRRHFEYGSPGNGIQHRVSLGRSLRGMHPSDSDRSIRDKGRLHNRPSSMADRTSRSDSFPLDLRRI